MLRVLFLVEGFTDIRLVAGLATRCDLTLAVPQKAFTESRLKERMAELRLRATVHEFAGGRVAYQARVTRWLWSHAGNYDVILAQELLRAALSANLVGRARSVPVVAYTALPPAEYWRCRRERAQIGPAKAWLGELVIRSLLRINGKLSSAVAAVGPYLAQRSRELARNVFECRAYGIDTRVFRPADAGERAELRRRIGLSDGFTVLLSSRLSHEKDPETVLRAVAELRLRGVNARLLNLSGEWQSLLPLALRLNLPEPAAWIDSRPPAHPMKELADFYRAADAVAQASLAEGLGLSPLEALACGTPVVATAVGGMALTLPGYAYLVARGDWKGMADALLEIHTNPAAARRQALHGRQYVERVWGAEEGFDQLVENIAACAGRSRAPAQRLVSR